MNEGLAFLERYCAKLREQEAMRPPPRFKVGQQVLVATFVLRLGLRVKADTISRIIPFGLSHSYEFHGGAHMYPGQRRHIIHEEQVFDNQEDAVTYLRNQQRKAAQQILGYEIEIVK